MDGKVIRPMQHFFNEKECVVYALVLLYPLPPEPRSRLPGSGHLVKKYAPDSQSPCGAAKFRH